jgi:phenylalanyl-tRNA synthetase beta chain
VGWLGEHVELPAELSPHDLGDALVRVGLEVERVQTTAITGPVVIGRVLSFADEAQKNGKSIRWCSVEVGEPEPRGIVCGASNFAVDDLVVVALPGAVLPGPFPITARKTYGHVSDGMICSVRELGLGDEHSGIMVLDVSVDPGEDALTVLGLRDAVLEIAVTPDRGYCLSMRGLAREASIALDAPYRDVAGTVTIPAVDGRAYPVRIEDPSGCDRFSMRAVSGVDPSATSPEWMQKRLRQAGMRPISLSVDITNYVMLETGQPLHAYDRDTLRGDIVVRRANPGERLRTLDDADRALDPDDLLITDESGPIGLAGVMGGASTEIGDGTTEVLLEAAHFAPSVIARAVRRHRLPSEAAKRFERNVDPEIAAVALQRCVDLLVEYGRGSAVEGFTSVGTPAVPHTVTMSAAYPSELSGMVIAPDAVRRRLEQVGCTVSGSAELEVRAPSWRPDLLVPADLVEEVARLEGYDRIPSELPSPPPGGGLTEGQKQRRTIARALAAAGFTEVLSYPFVAVSVHDELGLPADDPRRAAARLANPLSDAEPELRTSLLPGLFGSLHRNLGRGVRDLALFELGLVYLPRAGAESPPEPGIEHRPSDAEIDAMNAAIPDQPLHAAVVLCGDVERSGWWGDGRPATWADAVDAARMIAGAARADLLVRRGDAAPWHPGRCAELVVDGRVVGYAGELHPRVVAAMGLPERTCAMEVNLDLVAVPGPAQTPALSTFPPVLLDLALVVDAGVPAADVLEAVRAGAGELLESVRLFDVYTDAERLGAGLKSLAFAMRFRAADRTMTVEEATVGRDTAVAHAATTLGATLRA